MKPQELTDEELQKIYLKIRAKKEQRLNGLTQIIKLPPTEDK